MMYQDVVNYLTKENDSLSRILNLFLESSVSEIVLECCQRNDSFYCLEGKLPYTFFRELEEITGFDFGEFNFLIFLHALDDVLDNQFLAILEKGLDM